MNETRIYPTSGRLGEGDEAGTVNIPAGSVDPMQSAVPDPKMAEVHTIKVDGKEEQLTTAQLIERAQKGTAAEERFQQASTMKKDAASAEAIQEDLALVMQEGDIDAFRRIGVKYGVPADQIEEIAKNAFSDTEDDDADDDEDVINDYYSQAGEAGRRNPEMSSPTNVGYGNLSPDVQRALRIVEEQRINGIVSKALDTDEIVSYNMTRYDKEGQEAVREYIDDLVKGRLDHYGGDFGDGSQILADILPKVKKHLQALGNPKSRGPLGLGHAPGGGDSEVYPRKKPDHVSSNETDAFEQSIGEQIAFHHENAERAKRF